MKKKEIIFFSCVMKISNFLSTYCKFVYALDVNAESANVIIFKNVNLVILRIK